MNVDFRNLMDQYFVIHGEKTKGKGEDSYLLAIRAEDAVVGVFDGCGGSGAKVYKKMGDRTGAYIASRVLARETLAWFEGQDKRPEALKERFDRRLNRLKEQCQEKSQLSGSMKKEFPSTLSLVRLTPAEGKIKASFYWAGDSRGYLLNPSGLYQVTKDDHANPDAMVNLREDAGMTNVVSASVPYVIHERNLMLRQSGIFFTATDGCFGYLMTPMEMEKLLLETLQSAGSVAEWEKLLEAEFKRVSRDDYTLSMVIIGFHDFKKMKRLFYKRLAYMREKYPLSNESTEEELFAQWEEYKTEYESLQ